MPKLNEEEDDPKRLTRRLVHAVIHHPNKDALIADVQREPQYNLFSEESKQMIHNMGNVECFERCEISLKVQCRCCLKYWTEGIVHCTCGTCLVSTEFTKIESGMIQRIDNP